MIARILKSKIDLPHLIYLSVVAFLITGVIVNQFWPILIMMIYNVDINSQRALIPTAAIAIWVFSALIILGPFILLKMRANYNKGNLSKVKNYILVSILVFALSLVIVFY